MLANSLHSRICEMSITKWGREREREKVEKTIQHRFIEWMQRSTGSIFITHHGREYSNIQIFNWVYFTTWFSFQNAKYSKRFEICWNVSHGIGSFLRFFFSRTENKCNLTYPKVQVSKRTRTRTRTQHTCVYTHRANSTEHRAALQFTTANVNALKKTDRNLFCNESFSPSIFVALP